MKKLILLLLCGLCSAQQPNYSRMASGVNAQVGVTYTFVPADITQLVSFTNALPVAVTLPSPSTPGFGSGHVFQAQNNGAGAVTITCSGCTINGQPALPLLSGQGAEMWSNGISDYTALSTGAGGGGSGTISGVTAGAGLFGGGLSGSVTLKLQDCPINQIQQSGGPGTWNCAANAASPGAPANSIQFNLAGGFSGDSFFTYNAGTHTQTVQNQSITGTQTFAGPWRMDTSIPGSPLAVLGAGNSGLLISPDGNVCMYNNGGACADLSTVGGAGIVQAPLAGQTVTQPAGTTLNVNTFASIRYVTPSFNFSQSPAADLSAAGAKTVTLAPCPSGVIGADANLWVYIATQGTPEAVNVTGGTCTSGAASGTLTFTTLNVHAAGYTVASASSGIYEALRDATPSNNNNVRLILQPTNPPASVYYSVYAPITILGGVIEIEGGGTTIDCEATRACFVMPTVGNESVHIHHFRVGNRTTYAGAAITNQLCAANVCTITTTLNPAVGSTVDIQATDSVSLWGPHTVATTSGSSWTYACTGCVVASAATPGRNAYQNAFIETNSQGTQIDHIAFDTPGGFSGAMNNGFVVLNDQSFHLSDIQVVSNFSGCSANYCANLVYAPGSFSTNAAVIYADAINGTMNCSANGFTLYNGNTNHLNNVVVQGFNEWAVATGLLRGGFGPTILDNFYSEVGNCNNPRYIAAGLATGGPSKGMAGELAYGGQTTVKGGEAPIGNMPQFAATGANTIQLYVVVKDSVLGASLPMYIGFAVTNNAGTFTAAWPRVGSTNTITYDLLSTGTLGTGSSSTVILPPYFGAGSCPGGSPSACGSIATAIAQCAGLICTQTVTPGSNTTAYVVPAEVAYFAPSFWPGGIVNATSGNSALFTSVAKTYMDHSNFTGGQLNPFLSETRLAPTGFMHECANGAGGWSWQVCLAQSGNSYNATVITGGLPGGGAPDGLKGRLNFDWVSTTQGQIITLIDCTNYLTLASNGGRPLGTSCDTYIGADVPAGSVSNNVAQTAFGSPVSISNYIASLPDNTSWLERLTASLKSFKVPITTNSQITSTLANGTAPLVVASQTRVSNLKTGGNPLVISCGTTATCAAATLLNSFVVEGSVALTAGSASMTALPFTNTNWICTTNDVTTIANPSKLVQTGNTTGTVTGTGTDVINFTCAGN
jgi:hypothetical protein